jgi:hypothetical protein
MAIEVKHLGGIFIAVFRQVRLQVGKSIVFELNEADATRLLRPT